MFKRNFHILSKILPKNIYRTQNNKCLFKNKCTEKIALNFHHFFLTHYLCFLLTIFLRTNLACRFLCTMLTMEIFINLPFYLKLYRAKGEKYFFNESHGILKIFTIFAVEEGLTWSSKFTQFHLKINRFMWHFHTQIFSSFTRNCEAQNLIFFLI